MNDDAELRVLAHMIWECEGRPFGREWRHWELALKLAEAAALAPNRSCLSGVFYTKRRCRSSGSPGYH